VGLTNLSSKSETFVGSRVHLVGASMSFEKNFYQLPFTPPTLVRRAFRVPVKDHVWFKDRWMVTSLCDE
jgi:hypothetical protein